MRILITGDRNWRNATRLRECLSIIQGRILAAFPDEDEFTWIEGEAMGADIIAAVVIELSWPEDTIERYPAAWNIHGRSAGPIRNTQMRQSGVDFVVGFHNDIENSRGTKEMLRQCK